MANEEGPGGKPVGWRGVIPGAIILVGLSVLCLYSLVALWPHPTPSGTLKDSDASTPGERSAASTPAPPVSANNTTTVPSTANTTGAPSATNTAATPSAANATSSPSATNSTASPSDSAATTQAVAKAKECDEFNDKDECVCLARVDYQRKLHDQQRSADSPKLKDDPNCVNIFGRSRLIWNETRLILIVMLSGFLGSLVYSLRSFFWYTGNRELKWSWLLMYLLVPFVGAMLAVIFYMLLRGGLFSPTTTIADTSPFGFAAIAALVGMFINQASEKLRSVFETLMTEPTKGSDATKAATGRDAGTVQPPTLQSINPSPIPPDVDSTLTIKGAGFTQASVVFADGEQLAATFSSANELSAVLPAKMATGGSTISFVVSTPDAGKSSEMKVNVSAPTSPP